MQQTYLCFHCWTVVSYGQRACHNCGMILNWTQPALPLPHSQQNSDKQQAHEQPQLWNQHQLYNHSYTYSQPPVWGNQSQYWQQDVYGNPATKPKKQRVPRFAVSLMVSMFVVFMAAAIVFATNGNIFANTSSEQPALSMQQIADAYKQALVSPLNKASAEITDPKIASFYQKVVEGYALNGASENSSNSEGSLSSLVPDLKKIVETALNTSFKEVGKQIKDKEIADFYNSFIQHIGIRK